MVLCVSVARAQSTSAATAQNKRIDPALLAKANGGDAGAQYQLGYMYYHGDGVRRDYSQAEFWYRNAAEQGDPDSQLKLGGLYHFGRGVPQDSAEAFAWSMKAAEQGKSDAEFFIAACYTAGWGVAQDDAQAVVWLRKAAEQGDAFSQYMLGRAYEIGLGGPKDYAEAYFWLDLAASEKIKDTKRKEVINGRDEAALHLSPADQARVQERADEWRKNHPAQSQ
jgi:hypothetical protein